MTTQIVVDSLTFEFPTNWVASKYDDWSFYRKQFAKLRDGIKAVDVLAVDPSGHVWLIESKDYRRHPRTKPTEIPTEVVMKVFDTLAALLPTRANGNDQGEVDFAKRTLSAAKIHVVLHLEQPSKRSRLFPRAIDPTTVQQTLRKMLRPIDPHPKVASMSSMNSLQWTVK